MFWAIPFNRLPYSAGQLIPEAAIGSYHTNGFNNMVLIAIVISNYSGGCQSIGIADQLIHDAEF